jgi:hypothetical protein
MNQYRCIVVECCGKCIHSAYRSPTEQFCNREKPHWTLRLDQWADGISSCCTLPYQSERETATGGWKRYRCNSDTCSDSGGVCILCIPDMDFAPPTSCVNPEAFTDNGDEPDCEWEELRQTGEP